MSDNLGQNGVQMIMMAGFGALALFQGMAVYHMQKQIQKQNDIIIETERSEDSNEESKEAEPKRKYRSSNLTVNTTSPKNMNSKKTSFADLAATPQKAGEPSQTESINALLMLQLTKMLKADDQDSGSRMVRSRSFASQDDIGLISGASK